MVACTRQPARKFKGTNIEHEEVNQIVNAIGPNMTFLSITDDEGKTVIIPAENLAYIEFTKIR